MGVPFFLATPSSLMFPGVVGVHDIFLHCVEVNPPNSRTEMPSSGGCVCFEVNFFSKERSGGGSHRFIPSALLSQSNTFYAQKSTNKRANRRNAEVLGK